MRKALPPIILLILMAFFTVLPTRFAFADTGLNTELMNNGGAETGSLLPYWSDDGDTKHWNCSGTYEDWPPASEGSQYFFLYNPNMEASFAQLSSSMSQTISLSGTEGSGIFANIAAGNVAMNFSVDMYQKILTDNSVQAKVEEYSASDTLLATYSVACTTAGTGAFQTFEINTGLNSATRKLKVILSATLTKGGYAEYDAISLMLVDASTGSAPVFGSDFPTEGSTDSGVLYSHGFSIADADAGDVNNLTFSVISDNINLVPAANVAVTGSGTDRTLTVTPVSGLSGEANITVMASDGKKSATATLHLVVSKVISLGNNLVENGNATSGFASWKGSNVNVSASGNGFIISSPGYGMYQMLDISKFSGVIDGGAADYEFKVSGIWGTSGQVVIQFYTDIACTTSVGGSVTVNNSTLTQTGVIPVNAKGATVSFSSTGSSGVNCTIRNISFIILNNFPKMNAITAQTAQLKSLTVPVYVYYTATGATITATSSDQTIVADGGITIGGSGFERSLTFTPFKQGTATITATVNDGANTASRSFDVTVYEPATITGIGMPAAGYYSAGQNLDFTVTFSRDIQGGTTSTLPLTVGGYDETASYQSATGSAITYRYTLGSGDEGAVSLGAQIDSAGSAITDTEGHDAILDFVADDAGITAIPTPTVTGTATGGTATYGTQITFTVNLTCADTLTGTVQFQSDAADLGSPVALSGNQASYQTSATALDAGTHGITAIFIPGGTSCRFTGLYSSVCSVTILPKSVDVSGLSAANRAYDGTAAVALSGGSVSGVLSGDTVTGVFPTTGTASSANKGTQAVNFDDVTLTGADGGNYTVSAQPTVSVTISQKPITFTATASNKVYDGTTVAAVSGVTFNGLVTGETLVSGVDYTAAGVFDSVEISEDIPVTVTVTLKDTVKANNYTLSSDTATASADITKKLLTITGVTATDRAYNGDSVVELSGGTLAGMETGDAASLGFTLGNGVMADANAGSAKPVTTGITLTGSAADSYTLTQPTDVTVNIAKVDLTLTGAEAEDKAYDGNATATVTNVTVTGEITGETLAFGADYTATGLFVDSKVGADKTVTVTVTLADTATARNYALPVNTVGTKASIANSGVTLTGVTAVNRAYDGTVAVTLEGGSLVGVASADAADIGFTLNQGTVDSAAAGNGKAVTTAIALTGAKADNYTLTQPTGITVNIAKAGLTIDSASVADKVYSATTAATVTDVSFDGLVTGETLTKGVDYSASGVFASADAGTSVAVTVTVTLNDTAVARNYAIVGAGTSSGTITPYEITGNVAIDVTNGTGNPILLDGGDELRVDISGVTAPGTLTCNYQWYRGGAEISGATGNTCTVGDLTADPIGTDYTVAVTGTGNYSQTLTSAPATVVDIALSGTLTIGGDTKKGSVLTLDVSALTPATATYDIAWLRDGTVLPGEVGTAHTITDTDQGTTLTATVTGNGYFSGTVSALKKIPPSPYMSNACITDLTDRVAVNLTTGLTLLSEEQLSMLRALNASKPVVCNGNGYTITFPVGAMLSWSGDLDLGIRLNTGTGYAEIVGATGATFVMMFEFLHNGALPGKAEITLYVGSQYAGLVLRYLYYNPSTGKLELIQMLTVDAGGYVTFTQDHCSSYALARLGEDGVPKTGDNTPLALWLTLAGICAAGLLALFIWRMRKKRR